MTGLPGREIRPAEPVDNPGARLTPHGYEHTNLLNACLRWSADGTCSPLGGNQFVDLDGHVYPGVTGTDAPQAGPGADRLQDDVVAPWGP